MRCRSTSPAPGGSSDRMSSRVSRSAGSRSGLWDAVTAISGIPWWPSGSLRRPTRSSIWPRTSAGSAICAAVRGARSTIISNSVSTSSAPPAAAVPAASCSPARPAPTPARPHSRSVKRRCSKGCRRATREATATRNSPPRSPPTRSARWRGATRSRSSPRISTAPATPSTPTAGMSWRRWSARHSSPSNAGSRPSMSGGTVRRRATLSMSGMSRKGLPRSPSRIAPSPASRSISARGARPRSRRSPRRWPARSVPGSARASSPTSRWGTRAG